ncbi:BstXI family restriction endonuclease [Cryobacterium sp. TMT2-15-1]|nr:BstXI family restriction endonuclease [Cryobacterium sp. TMT2-15-1]
MKQIYQNRVSRNSTVLIPFSDWEECREPAPGEKYENGFIVLLQPSWYFETQDADGVLAKEGLELGVNALLYYQRRSDWNHYTNYGTGPLPNGKLFRPANARQGDLDGIYVARIHGTTATEGVAQLVHGFNETSSRGAGIRVYEYASNENLEHTRLQLEALLWLCEDAVDALTDAGMDRKDAEARRILQLSNADAAGLLDLDRLEKIRMIDGEHRTVCPLCLIRIPAADYLKLTVQAEGREVEDLTTTEVSLFHIQELRVGKLEHRPYNLGWGHHFCNVVVKDAGLIPTLQWMKGVLDNNGDSWEAIAEVAESIEEGVGD